jgi:hypothetical protein
VKHFWEKWMWSDWLGDPCVARASFAARGLWAEALNAMMAASTYEIGGNLAGLARILRCDVAELITAIDDLRQSGVCEVHVHTVNGGTDATLCHTNVNAIVTLVSRRRLREHKQREGARLRMERYRDSLSVTPPLQKSNSPPSNSNSNSNSSGGVQRGETDTEPPAPIPSVEAEAVTVPDVVAVARAVLEHKAKLQGVDAPIQPEALTPVIELLQRGYKLPDLIAVLDSEWRACREDKRQMRWFQVKLLFKPETFGDKLAQARPAHRKRVPNVKEIARAKTAKPPSRAELEACAKQAAAGIRAWREGTKP